MRSFVTSNRRTDWRNASLTSDRRERANRANAKSSTGPRTTVGKARAAQNALRHGLNVPIWSDPTLAPMAEAIARRIAGPGAEIDVLEHARRIAEAQVDLDRVRAYRRRMLISEIENSDYQPLRVRKLQALLLAKQERFSRGLGRPFFLRANRGNSLSEPPGRRGKAGGDFGGQSSRDCGTRPVRMTRIVETQSRDPQF
jgi:hypothetical protein